MPSHIEMARAAAFHSISCPFSWLGPARFNIGVSHLLGKMNVGNNEEMHVENVHFSFIQPGLS